MSYAINGIALVDCSSAALRAAVCSPLSFWREARTEAIKVEIEQREKMKALVRSFMEPSTPIIIVDLTRQDDPADPHYVPRDDAK
jgi:hypothetical protein